MGHSSGYGSRRTAAARIHADRLQKTGASPLDRIHFPRSLCRFSLFQCDESRLRQRIKIRIFKPLFSNKSGFFVPFAVDMIHDHKQCSASQRVQRPGDGVRPDEIFKRPVVGEHP